jgi:Zn-dependent M28 family amino/carboxypeptidase
MFKMPGQSYTGKLPKLTDDEISMSHHLKWHIYTLANSIGERNLQRFSQLQDAANYIKSAFVNTGLPVSTHRYNAMQHSVENIIATLPSSCSDELIIVSAHYDSVYSSPGATDDASGIAALIELAKILKNKMLSRTIRLVAFVNEEPPFFKTEHMGSLQYAKQCRSNNDNIVAMFSLDSIGYYSDAANSQYYPPFLHWFYPHRGNFIAFVTNLKNRKLIKTAISSFRRNTQFPSEGLAGPSIIPGVDWSDHWAFWKLGYPALLITDTAPLRNPYYHTPEDTAEKVNYDKLGRVVVGLAKMIVELANS